MKNYFKEIYKELDKLENQFAKISHSGKIKAKDITDMRRTIEFKKAEIISTIGNPKVIEKKITDIKTFYSLLV